MIRSKPKEINRLDPEYPPIKFINRKNIFDKREDSSNLTRTIKKEVPLFKADSVVVDKKPPYLKSSATGSKYDFDREKSIIRPKRT